MLCWTHAGTFCDCFMHASRPFLVILTVQSKHTKFELVQYCSLVLRIWTRQNCWLVFLEQQCDRLVHVSNLWITVTVTITCELSYTIDCCLIPQCQVGPLALWVAQMTSLHLQGWSNLVSNDWQTTKQLHNQVKTVVVWQIKILSFTNWL